MPYGLYISAEGAMAQSKRLEVIANNIANVQTVGFKRDLALFQARYAEATERGQDAPGSGSVNDLGGGITVRATATDFRPGPLKRTDSPTDVAVDGPGFFQVRRGTETYLTRAGNFQLDVTGQLRTQDGDLVLDDSGGPIALDPELPWRFTPEGAVEQQGAGIFLSLVQPQQPGDLVKHGNNLFRPLAPPAPLAAEVRHLLPGHLEMSAVQPAAEMMTMIETSRAFEANTNLIRNQDQLIGTLISRVLRTNA